MSCAVRRRRSLAWLAGTVLGFGGFAVATAGAPMPDPIAAFQSANERYRAGRFDQAEQGYCAILDQGLESGPVYYNLGNALVKQGRNAEALWAYLRAQRLMPRDPDLRANIEYARGLLPEAGLVSVGPPPAARWLALGGTFAASELLALALAASWIAAVAWALAGWLRRSRALFRVAAVFASLLVCLGLSALTARSIWVDGPDRALAVRSATANFSPDAKGTAHFALPEGAVVRVVHRQPGWAQIQRRDGRQGWVAEQAVKPL